MDHANSGLEGRFDQIQHPIRRQDAQPLTLPFTQNSVHPRQAFFGDRLSLCALSRVSINALRMEGDQLSALLMGGFSLSLYCIHDQIASTHSLEIKD
jgi:hypothetical protein